MGSKERTILTQMRTTIRGINGAAGGYDYDLSGDDSVFLYGPADVARAPCAYILILRTDSLLVPGRTRLDSYDRRMVIAVEMYVPAPGQGQGDAALAALDAQDDLMLALEKDRTLAGNVEDLRVSATSYDGAEFELSGYGLVAAEVELSYRETAGV